MRFQNILWFLFGFWVEFVERQVPILNINVFWSNKISQLFIAHILHFIICLIFPCCRFAAGTYQSFLFLTAIFLDFFIITLHWEVFFDELNHLRIFCVVNHTKLRWHVTQHDIPWRFQIRIYILFPLRIFLVQLIPITILVWPVLSDHLGIDVQVPKYPDHSWIAAGVVCQLTNTPFSS